MFFRSKAVVCPVLASLLLTTSGPLLLAQSTAATTSGTDAAVVRLPEIVVTPTGTESTTFDVPYTANVLEAGRIQTEQMARTVPEALRETPAVMVQKTAHGQGSPYIRGFTGFRTLFLIDGIRINNSTFRDGPNQYWNTVDPFSLSRLELVKGPSSVLYGSDAIGGTVNAFTLGTPEEFTGRAYYRYGDAEASHTGRSEFGGATGNLQYIGGFSIKSYGDLNGQPYTGYDEYCFDLKALYKLSTDSRLIAAWQHVDQNDAWRTHRTIYARSFADTAIGTDQRLSLDQQRDLAYLQYHAENLGEYVESFKLSASYHFQGETGDRIRDTFVRELSNVDVNTLGLWSQVVSPSPVGTWTYGAEYYRDWVDSGLSSYNPDGSLSSVSVQGPVADDATYDLFGLYAQDQIPLPGRLELILGGRYTYAHVDAGKVRDPITGATTSINEDWQSLVGNARLSWQVDKADHWRLFGGVSQGFRAPNLSDLSRLDTARSGEMETAAPNLDPEDFVAFELGTKTQYGAFSGEVAYFYTLIDNMIVRQPTGRTVNGLAEVTKRNSGDGYLHGVEASARWQLHPQLSLFGWITWMEGEVDGYPTASPETQTEYITRMMPVTGEVGLRWETPGKRVWAEVVTLMARGQDRLSSGDVADTQRVPPGGTPGYAILTLRGGWRVNEHFTVSMACENLLDEEYRVHGSGVNEPDRNFVFAGEVRF